MLINRSSILDEVDAMHSDLALWIGSCGRSDALDRFEAQVHSDFSQVSLDGESFSYDKFSRLLKEMENFSPGLSIEICDLTVLHQSTDCAVVRFREIHHSIGTSTARMTTALLLVDPQARNGLRWRAVHETATTL